ncbi:MAG: 50S ribosomal protein L31e [Candidatus Nanoarchaeia archaeon]|nr:50S ribosomal protein L31e [Candidatus Nanoarchaeia archaeon]
MERIYNVPLRREFSKVPSYKKAKKAVTALKAYLTKHMKSEEIKIDAALNEFIWKHGIKSPPHHVKLKAVKDEKTNIVTAYLVDEEVFTNKVLRHHNKYTIAEKVDKKSVEKEEANKETKKVTKKTEEKSEESKEKTTTTTTKKETTKDKKEDSTEKKTTKKVVVKKDKE